jgi:hypothetical protein
MNEFNFETDESPPVTSSVLPRAVPDQHANFLGFERLPNGNYKAYIITTSLDSQADSVSLSIVSPPVQKP